MEKEKEKRKAAEPQIVIRPIGRLGGLDNIHMLLIALVVVLIAIILVLSYSKPQVVLRNQTIPCQYGAVNNTCVVPLHNRAQVEMQAEKILATYGYMNNSLALLPYITNVSRMQVTFLPSLGEWYVQVPATNPATNVTFYFSMLIDDSNLSLVAPFIQALSPSLVLSNYVIAKGVVKVSGKYACLNQTPLSVSLFIDPYQPGSMQVLSQLIGMENKFGNKVNFSLKVLYGPYSQIVASHYNETAVLDFDHVLLCASQQSNFPAFLQRLNSVYTGSIVQPSILQNIVAESDFNASSFNECISNSASLMNRQMLLAEYYNITTTPVAIVNCEYLTVPQALNDAICYANDTLCR